MGEWGGFKYVDVIGVGVKTTLGDNKNVGVAIQKYIDVNILYVRTSKKSFIIDRRDHQKKKGETKNGYRETPKKKKNNWLQGVIGFIISNKYILYRSID